MVNNNLSINSSTGFNKATNGGPDACPWKFMVMVLLTSMHLESKTDPELLVIYEFSVFFTNTYL